MIGSPPERGFTLIEMLVVLTVIGLLAAVAMSNIAIRPAFVDRATIRTGFEAAVARARQQAEASGRPVTVDLTTIRVPDLRFVASLGGDRVALAYPDGSTTGGTLTRKGKPMLAFDWMTGRIRDAAH